MLFFPKGPFTWYGRNKHFPGRGGTFYLEYNTEYSWWPCLFVENDEGCYYAWAIDQDNIRDLVKWINKAKALMTPGSSGGSFLINEFGQVLVPSNDGDGRVMFIGDIDIHDSLMLFFNPLSGAIIDLSYDLDLEFREYWDRPCVGMVYNLSQKNRLYYYSTYYLGSKYEEVPCQDENLIALIREIRPGGAVTFIVNPYGIVLTKKLGDPINRHTYIGRINYDLWFDKELTPKT